MANPSITSLPCGCFFQGRIMTTDPECEEHHDQEDEWSCDNCGETAMDGSGVCVTCGTTDEAQCDKCGKFFPTDHLDGKPTINSKLRRIRAREGQLAMLRRAADKGYEFDRLECRGCYGPGYLQN